jgi:hypothetical protein
MTNPTSIRLLAAANNERGDLFTRLTKDLFFALGYDNLRLDVHKSGRELDLQGEHRFEPRRVVGECKAHVRKMGGDELNKFFGALGRERKKHAPIPVAGYFVSLGGFTETGIEQEIETGDDRVILLDAKNVVDELERCRVIVPYADAVERAGHCAQHAGLRDAQLDSAELLGHQRGYVWAILYAQGKESTHLALIHADGTPLAEPIAREVIEADRLCGGALHLLRYLPPPNPAPDRIALAKRVAASYQQWLGEECGYIHLDGLPADTDLSATRLKLERLFVPLKATFLPKPDDSPELQKSTSETILSIGELMGRAPHLAVLAAPGGGKTTLLKRLATAYAFPERRGEVSDDLPQCEWLPLILRCRELRDRAHRPIIELLDDIPRHAGMSADECISFQETAHGALRNGHALLLVDGLDEISDEGARQTFASHLRTFLAMFPQAALVVTSREAGFRFVAGVVASACEQAKLAPLDEDDVLSLCERWHVEVVGDNDKVRAEAKELGRAIWGNERIRMLTENPLLLTTLLVVKRWVRELPRSRTELYREAIRVLVRTWNVEGYAPLDEGETLAQLSYVACAMMEDGKQQIGQRALLTLLQNARRELEAELQFARISPQDFIERIEYRSSLLMQTGHVRSDGLLEPVYEFRHLTFQEYLAARGYVEEQYPGRDSGRSLADLLGPHFQDERWQEVIPLAAVLAGRKAEELLKRLIRACEDFALGDARRTELSRDPLAQILHQCIRDEVQITAPTLRLAILELARYRRPRTRELGENWVAEILRGKFGEIFQELVEHEYLAGGDDFNEYNGTMAQLAHHVWFADAEPVMTDSVAVSLRNVLETGDRNDKIRAAFACMNLAYSGDNEPKHVLKAHFQSLLIGLAAMLTPSDWPSALAASWAIAWIGEHQLMVSPPEPQMLLSLFGLWRQGGLIHRARYPAWALQAQALLSRNTFDANAWGDCDIFLRQAVDIEDFRLREMKTAALVVGWYRRAPWNDNELAEQIGKNGRGYFAGSAQTGEAMLKSLGRMGRLVLNEWKRESERLVAPKPGRQKKMRHQLTN